VLTAVHVDKQLEASRGSSVVISGLCPETGVTDTELVNDLYSFELGFTPRIVRCKRLGAVDPAPADRAPGHVQPILVTMESTVEAGHVLAGAKLLRQSRNAHARDKIYTNKFMSKAEQRAAYEVRCHRRRINRSRPDEPASAPRSTNQPRVFYSSARGGRDSIDDVTAVAGGGSADDQESVEMNPTVATAAAATVTDGAGPAVGCGFDTAGRPGDANSDC